MIKNGKYYLPPPEDGSDFKEIFSQVSAAGAGRPVDKDGFPNGPWMPDLLAAAISEIDANRSGIELRTVQLWFQDNDKGISAENIRWLARIFGCGDPDAVGAWQSALSSGRSRLAAKRRSMRKAAPTRAEDSTDPTPIVTLDAEADPKPNDAAQPTLRRFSIARRCEALFSGHSSLNLPAIVWAGCVTLGFLTYITDVHSITYSPISGLNKQVGYFWAPNWTVLELVILPLFLIIVVELLKFWRAEGRSRLMSGETGEIDSWYSRVDSFSQSHWAAAFICFGIVFALQWFGVHFRALMQGDVGRLMVDWNVMAIVRPAVMSVPEAIAVSMLAFLYTAVICYLFLTGLIFLCTLATDFFEICGSGALAEARDRRHEARLVGTRLLSGIFRCTVLGILITTCIKLQATYLVSDGETIFRWLMEDALFALGAGEVQGGWLEQRALAHFTSFLLLFATCSVFLYAYIQIYRVIGDASSTDDDQASEDERKLGQSARRHCVPWRRMLMVVTLLVANFLMIGQFPGFSLLLCIAILVAVYSLFDPQLGLAHQS
ncbi:RcgA family putative transporter [Seohaeicola nanhaiensis]|uniref:RcgA family putative transporter n=1 Tax=Seohaeicola nanhaiensis TaxID=1387282 RepID=A0ABV9KL07_9RHOB